MQRQSICFPRLEIPNLAPYHAVDYCLVPASILGVCNLTQTKLNVESKHVKNCKYPNWIISCWRAFLDLTQRLLVQYITRMRNLRMDSFPSVWFKWFVVFFFSFLRLLLEEYHSFSFFLLNFLQVLAQVIRFHPKVPGVWIYAAAWEFDHNLNATAARALMQSGLRVCPTSEDLWVEYLRMELTYLNKLKARKVALGEDEGTLINDHRDADEKQWREENKDLFMSLDEERGSRDVSNGQNEESKKKSDMFQEQGLSILRTIYSGAVEAIPSRFSLRTQFFEILEAINLAGSKEMQKEILSDMKRDFSAEPEYWDWLARLETIDSESTQERSTDIVPSQLQKAVQVGIYVN